MTPFLHLLSFFSVSELNGLSLFCKLSPTIWPSTYGGFALLLEHILEWVLEKNTSISCGEDEPAQLVMKCGDVMALVGHANQLIRVQSSRVVCSW